MFDDGMFEDWPNKKAAEVFEKVGRGRSIRSDEIMILVLKAQANRFIHLDTDLRKDMNKRFEAGDKRSNDLRGEYEQAGYLDAAADWSGDWFSDCPDVSLSIFFNKGPLLPLKPPDWIDYADAA